MKQRAICQNCYDKNWLIECKCGCGQVIFKRSKFGGLRKCVIGHKPGGKDHPMWKGGRIKNNSGYWMILKSNYPKAYPSGYVLEHVYIYEQYYQCSMLPWGVVHHMDENKENNDISNLKGITWWQHSAIHMRGKQWSKKDMSNRICSKCNSKDTWLNNDKYPSWYPDEEGGNLCKNCYNNSRMKRIRKSKSLSPTKYGHICLECKRDYTCYAWYNYQNGKVCNNCFRRLKRAARLTAR